MNPCSWGQRAGLWISHWWKGQLHDFIPSFPMRPELLGSLSAGTVALGSSALPACADLSGMYSLGLKQEAVPLFQLTNPLPWNVRDEYLLPVWLPFLSSPIAALSSQHLVKAAPDVRDFVHFLTLNFDRDYVEEGDALVLKFLFNLCCTSSSLWEFLILRCLVCLVPTRMYCVVSPFW